MISQRLTLIVWTFLVSATTQLLAQSTAFTYQGLLNEAGSPASGTNYGMVFTLYDASTNGAVRGSQEIINVPVKDGQFSVLLDFGNVFDGTPRWLDISVQKDGAPYVALAPRQLVTPVPSTLYSSVAGVAGFATTATAASSVAGTSLGGVFSLAQLPATVITNGQGQLALFGAFSGDGRGITNVPGAVPWFVCSSNITASPNTGCLLTNASQTVVTLPLSSALHSGDIVRVTGTGAGGWKLSQNSGQSVLANFGAHPQPATTVGLDGYLSGLQDSAVTLEYIGNGQFLRVNGYGVISVN